MRKAQHSSPVKQGFTVSMACMDTLPVLFFSISIITIASRFHSILFLTGSILVIIAGALKVTWKFLLALAKKDIPFFNKQMRFLMPAGFLLILLSLFIDPWSFPSVIRHILTFPSALFILIGIIGIISMIYAGRHLDGHDPKSNWIEQTINSLTQFFIMLGILL